MFTFGSLLPSVPVTAHKVNNLDLSSEDESFKNHEISMHQTFF